MFDNNSQNNSLTSAAAVNQWIAPIARWAVYQHDSDQSGADVNFIDSSLRRKLSSLTKMSLKVAHDCSEGLDAVRLVYASRHGELTRTTAMLADLADEQILSPTAFSMSVLNVSTGVYSITKQDRSPSTAVSSGESSFGFGLLEACLQLAANPELPVLLVYADEPAPVIYGVRSESFKPHAIGLLLMSGSALQISCQTACGDVMQSLNLQSQAFLQCLERGDQTAWSGEGRTWNWSRHG